MTKQDAIQAAQFASAFYATAYAVIETLNAFGFCKVSELSSDASVIYTFKFGRLFKMN